MTDKEDMDRQLEGILNNWGMLDKAKEKPVPPALWEATIVQEVDCPKCGGTGIVQKPYPEFGDSVAFPVDCEDCGAGKVWKPVEKVTLTMKEYEDKVAKEYIDPKTGAKMSVI